MKYRNIEERLIANSVPEHTGHKINGEPSECWIWIGPQNGRGYGLVSMRINGKHRNLKAHHVAAKALAGVTLDEVNNTWEHECRQTLCIHPNHGRPMPNALNAAGRGWGKKRT
jgi:hypothetical protein